MDIYRILEKLAVVEQDSKQLNEGIIGSIAGGLAGTAVGGPIGGVVGSALGNAVTDEGKEEQWDAQALAQHKARLAREKNAMMMQRKISGQDTGLPPAPVTPRPMDEAEMMDHSSQGLDHICRTHKAACNAFLKGGDLDSELYDALYNHYLSNGEMPYGVAKARDGDPMNWCAEKLSQHLGLEECGTGMSMDAGEFAPMAESVDRISFLAGLTEGKMCSACNCKPCECDDVEEGNDFTKARKDAIAAGKPTFKCGGKTYKVKGDTSDEKKQVEEAKAKPDFLDMDKDGNKKEPMKKALKDKKVDESKAKPAFPGSPEYEKKYGKVKHDSDSAFEKTKTSTGTVYKRKLKDEPEEKEDDDTPKKKGRKVGTGKKIGAKGPSTTSKLLTGKNKGGLKEGLDIEDQGEYDEEGSMVKDNIHTIRRAIDELENCVGDNDNMPEWVEEKISQAKGMIQSASEYIQTQKERGAEEDTGKEGITMDEAGYSSKAARAGKDIGKPGKNFAKIAKSSGGGEKGQRIAGAVLNKLRHPTDEGTIEERSVSQAQQRTMGAAAHNPKFAKKVGIKPGVAKEFNRADTGHKMSELPQRVKETGMGGTVAGGMAPAPGAKTFAEASSSSHEAAWKAAGKAVHAIMKKRGYTGSKVDNGYMWTKQTPRGTAFVDIGFDERDPEWASWGEGELKGAKNKSYWESGNDHIGDLPEVIADLFANVKPGEAPMDEADEDGMKAKTSFGKKDSKHKPDDDGDGVPDWADKKPGKDDSEESDEDDDKALKKMKSHAGIEDKDDDSDAEESDDKPKKGKKPDFGKKKDDESDDQDDSDDSDDKESDDADDSDKDDEKESKDESAEQPKKNTSGTPYGKSVYESAFKKSLKTQLRESINMNTSQDSDGNKSVTVTATDEDADKLSELLKMAGLFSSQGYSSVCQGCSGVHEAGACGHNNDSYGEVEVAVAEDLANSPDEHYSDENTMLNTLSGGLNGPKSTGQSTGPVVNRQDSRQGLAGEVQKVQEAARNRLWKLYGDMSSK